MRRDQRGSIAIAGDTCAFLSYPRLSNRAKNKAAEASGFGGHSKSAMMMRMIVHAVLKIAAACIEIERPHDVIPIGFINRAIIKIIGKFNAV